MESAEATCLHVQNGPRLCNAQRLAACKRNIIFTTPVLQKHHKTGQDNLGQKGAAEEAQDSLRGEGQHKVKGIHHAQQKTAVEEAQGIHSAQQKRAAEEAQGIHNVQQRRAAGEAQGRQHLQQRWASGLAGKIATQLRDRGIGCTVTYSLGAKQGQRPKHASALPMDVKRLTVWKKEIGWKWLQASSLPCDYKRRKKASAS
eukprot:633467-Pelagomonas_calceolata.AAC.2